MIWLHGATVHTFANDELISFNKFVYQISMDSVIYFFINILTPLSVFRTGGPLPTSEFELRAPNPGWWCKETQGLY